MSDSQRDWQDLVREIDDALKSNPVLSGPLLDDVENLKREVVERWSAREYEEAERAHSLAISIIKTGSPAKE